MEDGCQDAFQELGEEEEEEEEEGVYRYLWPSQGHVWLHSNGFQQLNVSLT